MGAKIQGPVVLQQAYDLTVWYAERTAGFPKAYRFTLADRIQQSLFNLLGAIQEAVFDRKRAEHLARAQVEVDRLRLWNRLAKDLHCLSPRQ